MEEVAVKLVVVEVVVVVSQYSRNLKEISECRNLKEISESRNLKEISEHP